MKVLWVTPYKPDPRGGAGVSSEFELLRGATRHHEITLITADLPAGTFDLDLGDRILPISGVDWEPRREARGRAAFASQFVRAYPSHEHWFLGARVDALRAAIREHHARHPVDLVHFTSAEMASLVAACDAPAVLLAFDVFSRQSVRERELATTRARRTRWWVEHRRMVHWERRWLPRFDGVATVSSVEAEAIHELTGVDADVIPTPLPDVYFEPPLVERRPHTVTLVANLQYRPNVDAVEWLTTEIWPKVLDLVPEAQLEVVGAHPAPAVIAAVDRAGGTLFANVDDVRPHYWRAAVAVAPIRRGSGLRNKVLHAMACGAPLIATTTALEGIAAVDREHVLVADDPEPFAAAIVESLRDRAAAQQRAISASGLLDAYRSARVGEQFESWWARAAASAPRQ